MLALGIMSTATGLETFLLGLALGLHLASTTRQPRARGEPRASTSAVLAAQKEASIDDERMLCPTCWESRHPGLHWFLARRVSCHEHSLYEAAYMPAGAYQEQSIEAHLPVSV